MKARGRVKPYRLAVALLGSGLLIGPASAETDPIVIQVSVTVEPYAVVTWMSGTVKRNTNSLITFQVSLPDFITPDRLDLSRIELDGIPMTYQSANFLEAGTVLKLVVYRDDAILGLPPITGPVLMQLDIGLVGGHTLSASGYVRPQGGGIVVSPF